MNTRVFAAAAALALAVSAPATAFAQGRHDHAQPAWQQRAIDSSAKGGNASQPEREFPQYGTTAGGPAA
ncbi:hypothetical protein [Methylobacterium brachythecii]|uniref:Uncharacterized protein n=1 Tax=Methylobacterium brachythecii TaxID=1176177 RepID=A0A7W6F6C8_9HYPH|nr:hypothetical protein [Methylobacterium brachythecii]MBB3901866.1 hypothetical protein [Methylobacterium brachythecii]GLS43246.1 hypothetical protein GCM10007884_12310 [Methylobacterium brachythecii]